MQSPFLFRLLAPGDYQALNEIIEFDANTTLGIDELEARRTTLIVDNLSLERVEFFRANITPIEGIFPVNVQNGTATVEIEDNDSKFLNIMQQSDINR